MAERRGVRILLVEDNPHLAEMLRGALGTPDLDFDLELHGAVDGAEALDHLAAHQFDLAIVDIYLPRIDGAEVIRRLRGEPRHATLPVIAVSAGGEPARAAALAAGASTFMEKPIRLRQMFETVRRLTSQG